MANIISDETIEYVGILAKLELNEEEKEQANRIELAQGLLADGMSIEFTVRHSKLTEAAVRELASKLSA